MKNQILSLMASGLFILISLSACKNERSTKINQNLTNDELISIAKKVYVYGYPLVLMEYTKRVSTNVSEPTTKGAAPLNQIENLVGGEMSFHRVLGMA